MSFLLAKYNSSHHHLLLLLEHVGQLLEDASQLDDGGLDVLGVDSIEFQNTFQKII